MLFKSKQTINDSYSALFMNMQMTQEFQHFLCLFFLGSVNNNKEDFIN